MNALRNSNMGKLLAFFVACSLLLALPSTAIAAEVKITPRAFKYGGVRYFRGKAENVRLASYGEKKTPVGKTNYLAVQGDVHPMHLAKLKVKVMGPFKIDWKETSDSDFNASIKYLDVAGVAGSLSKKKAVSANLKLVKFVIDEGQLKYLMNDVLHSVRTYMKDEGRDARIVSEVWVAMDSKLAEDVVRTGKVTGGGQYKGFNVDFKASGSSNTSTRITIPNNTTFAYLLHKVKSWNKKGLKRKSVKNLEDDQHGPF